MQAVGRLLWRQEASILRHEECESSATGQTVISIASMGLAVRIAIAPIPDGEVLRRQRELNSPLRARAEHLCAGELPEDKIGLASILGEAQVDLDHLPACHVAGVCHFKAERCDARIIRESGLDKPAVLEGGKAQAMPEWECHWLSLEVTPSRSEAIAHGTILCDTDWEGIIDALGEGDRQPTRWIHSPIENIGEGGPRLLAEEEAAENRCGVAGKWHQDRARAHRQDHEWHLAEILGQFFDEPILVEIQSLLPVVILPGGDTTAGDHDIGSGSNLERCLYIVVKGQAQVCATQGQTLKDRLGTVCV